jgi:hypothetical protein
VQHSQPGVIVAQNMQLLQLFLSDKHPLPSSVKVRADRLSRNHPDEGFCNSGCVHNAVQAFVVWEGTVDQADSPLPVYGFEAFLELGKGVTQRELEERVEGTHL